jgi:hypothetical protein
LADRSSKPRPIILLCHKNKNELNAHFSPSRRAANRFLKPKILCNYWGKKRKKCGIALQIRLENIFSSIFVLTTGLLGLSCSPRS